MTLRGAILGAGNIAQHGHLPAYAAVSPVGERCEIVAAADLCEQNLASIASLTSGVRTFRSAARLLKEVRPDFVDICAPPFVHLQLIELASSYGCHILCEKPLSISLSDAERVDELLSGRSLVFVPGHQYHHAPMWMAIGEAIRAGEIGMLRRGRISIEREAANPGNPHWNPDWRTSEGLSGGGILMDHGSHLFYQLRSLLGQPLRVDAKVEARRQPCYGVEDTALCELQFEGASVEIELTWAARRRRTLHCYEGTQGTISCDENVLRVAGGGGCRTLEFESGFSQDSSHAAWYIPLIDGFLGRIERSDFDRSPLDEALLTMRCVAAAYESAHIGMPVDL